MKAYVTPKKLFIIKLKLFFLCDVIHDCQVNFSFMRYNVISYISYKPLKSILIKIFFED